MIARDFREARQHLNQWVEERSRTAGEFATILRISEVEYRADPLVLIEPLQSYVSRLPLEEFEVADWNTLHNDLASYLADLLIRRDQGSWTVVEDSTSPVGYRYLIEARGKDGLIRTVDPYDVAYEEFAFPPIQVLRMIVNAETVIEAEPPTLDV